ncbi:MAG: hypothetical protein Q9197_002018 [Variospora fuerteventurae]
MPRLISSTRENALGTPPHVTSIDLTEPDKANSHDPEPHQQAQPHFGSLTQLHIPEKNDRKASADKVRDNGDNCSLALARRIEWDAQLAAKRRNNRGATGPTGPIVATGHTSLYDDNCFHRRFGKANSRPVEWVGPIFMNGSTLEDNEKEQGQM